MPSPGREPEIYEIYSDQLRSLKHGLPMYEPEPNGSDGPVQIGDVGYIDFGRFICFSNIFSPLQGIPAVDEQYHKILELGKLDNGVMSSRSVRSQKIEVQIAARETLSGASVGASFHFSCTSDRGASLITRHRSINQKAQYHNVLKEHFVKHIDDYAQLANNRRLPISNTQDIVLIIGRVMTGDWATIIFDSREQENSASFDINAATISASGEVWGRWSEHNSYPKRHGPSRAVSFRDNEEPPAERLDQCIFISPFRVAGVTWYKRIKNIILTGITQKGGSLIPPTLSHGNASNQGFGEGQPTTYDGPSGSSSTMNTVVHVPGLSGADSDEDELLTAYEVLAFHAFQVSTDDGAEYDLICVEEEDVQYFQATSCLLRELDLRIKSQSFQLTVVGWESVLVPRNPQQKVLAVGRLQRSRINQATSTPDASSAEILDAYSKLEFWGPGQALEAQRVTSDLTQKSPRSQTHGSTATNLLSESPQIRTRGDSRTSTSSANMAQEDIMTLRHDSTLGGGGGGGGGGYGYGGQRQTLSNYQVEAMNRNYIGCDECHKDRKRCEGGVPCSRCVRTRKTCTSQGVSQRQYLNELMSQTYGPNCFFAKYIDREGYYAIFSPGNGCKYFQRLTNFYQPVGQPQFIGYDRDLDVSRIPYNVDFTVDDLLNAGRT